MLGEQGESNGFQIRSSPLLISDIPSISMVESGIGHLHSSPDPTNERSRTLETHLLKIQAISKKHPCHFLDI